MKKSPKGAELKPLDTKVVPISSAKTATARSSAIGRPLHIQEGTIRPKADQQALNEIHKGVGNRIIAQGGNKVLVITPDDEAFRAFKRMNPRAERFIFRCDDAITIKKHPRADVMVLGAFWAHRNWDAMYRQIQEKTSIAPHVKINWFPF
jgi:hypothetical protein